MRHELHLMVRGLGALTVVTALLAVAGAAFAGAHGAASVVVGAGVVAVNHVVAAFSTGWARTLTAKVAAIGYGVFLIRMFAVFGGLAALTGVAWIHRGLLATAFVVALAVALGAECLSYMRSSYVPRWRVVAR